jgi:glycine oxidase
MDETGFDRSIEEAKVRQVHQAAARLLPALEAPRPSSFWADLRPISVDNLPILGGDPEVQGLFYATGYGRNGILLSPLAGRVLADLVLTGRLPQAWAAFAPARFRG